MRCSVRRRNHVGTASLLAAVAGAIACHLALGTHLAQTAWLHLLTAGFEAALVGGLADWFAVTALFRRPLGLPIPHTALLRERRDKLIEGIVSMVENEWLSPTVIGERLARVAPSALVAEWLGDPEHVGRLGGPLRDLLRALARLLAEPEVAALAERTIQGQLRELPIDRAMGPWLTRMMAGASAAAAFDTLVTSLANLAARPRTAAELRYWLDRSAQKLHEEGKRLVPLVLRRRVVQRKIVEAVCGYAASELGSAAGSPDHPLRRLVFGALASFADRLGAGEPAALAQTEQVRTALVESLEAGPLVRAALAQLRAQLEHDLDDPQSYLSGMVDRELRAGILDLLTDPARAAAFDHWVRTMAHDLLERHHHQIGVTVRENLEALDPDLLVARIEDRVGSDLQYIRLNGAVVGGLIGVLLALARLLLER